MKKKTNSTKQHLKVVAKELGVPKGAVKQMAKDGIISFELINGLYYVYADEVREALEEKKSPELNTVTPTIIHTQTENEKVFAKVFSELSYKFHTTMLDFTIKLDRTSTPSTKITMLKGFQNKTQSEMLELSTAFKVWDKSEKLNNHQLIQGYMDHYHTLRSTYFTQGTHILLLQQVSPIQSIPKSIVAGIAMEINTALGDFHDKCYDLPIITEGNIDTKSVEIATKLAGLVGIVKSGKYALNLEKIITENKLNEKDTKYVKKIVLGHMENISTYMAGDLHRKGYLVAMANNTAQIIPLEIA